ncbi:MAG: RDD family protein [Saprospiraceae bacterium]|nr:RDD family protein [Saprospiraceae bacterium]
MQTIEITTTQNVTIEYELAGLRERFFALFIDLLIGFGIWMALIFLTISVRKGMDSEFLTAFVFGFPFWYIILYPFICESFLDAQTIGKRSQNIKVIRIDGKQISLSDFFLRAIFMLVDFALTLGGLGALLILTTERRQRLGDMAAGTISIRLTNTTRRFQLEDILNINSLENYTPQYMEVKKLSEDDMLFIKSVVQRFQKYPNLAQEESVRALFTHLQKVLELPNLPLMRPQNMVDFFKTLIKDYIVLTR